MSATKNKKKNPLMRFKVVSDKVVETVFAPFVNYLTRTVMEGEVHPVQPCCTL